MIYTIEYLKYNTPIMFDIKKLKEDPNVNIYSRRPEIDSILKGFLNLKKSLIVTPVPFNNETKFGRAAGMAGQTSYSSSIIKIAEDYITIDSLMPQNGNLSLLESSYLKLNFKFKNNEHFFVSKLYDFRKNNDYFKFNIYKPLEILSLEKRKYFRIEPSLKEPVGLSFFLNNKYFNANIYDIGGEGISFLLDFPIEKHTVLEGVKIEFPGNIQAITVRMEIRAATRLDNLKYKTGAQLINLGHKEQDIMFKYIFKRQREIVAAMKGI